jgi:predicted dehydrogenase
MLRIGLLGAARIAPGAVIQPAAQLPAVKVLAVAASRPEKAKAFADQHDVPGIAESYGALIDSPDIDAVYNALPPNLHEKWSVEALRAGKHVLCEKPFAMNATQARRMVEAADASKRILIEAFHYRFHPYFQRVLDLLSEDVIGSIQHIDSKFDVRIPYSPSEFRHDPNLGGGALMDLGCYAVHWVRTLMGAEPQVEQAECTRSEAGVDVATRASLRFSNGVTAQITSAMNESLTEQHCARVVIEGGKGRMTLANPIAPHNGNAIIVEADEMSYEETVSADSTYFHQLEHFISAVEGLDTPLTGGEDAINNMQVIDDIYAAADFARPELV